MPTSTPAARSRSPTIPIRSSTSLLEHARTTADIYKRIEDYCAISRLINKEAIWFWTFQNTYYAISTAKLKGLPKMYSGVIDVSAPGWNNLHAAFFVARRLLYLVPVLIAVSLLTFLIASLLPGDLAYTILADQATPENVAALRHDMGLDEPIWWRYLGWLGHVIEGDLGRSFRTGQTVLQALAERLPVSFELMLFAQIIALAIGVPLAIVCAARSGGPFDRFMTGTAFAMLSVPAFLSAILLIYLFAVELRWLPATGYVPFTEDPVGNLRFFVLPSLTLALAEWPGIMRILRSDMIATLQEDYITLAKAKGLKSSRILFVHALKPSSLTLITITGINIGRLMGGTVIVETIFALPGIGRLVVGAIGTRDLIILQGTVLCIACGYVLMNFIVDMLYAVIDPRIRHGHA